ncbi:hypothetical protein N7455_008542 [Penicillium solitum]|uniref:uncharacterized protein n=1 Tax=Penicillium solitum TaxID=60172 RepID=UPI0032C42CF6|nr:hypothetical protein N7455_008542 [Penicillium solitum]
MKANTTSINKIYTILNYNINLDLLSRSPNSIFIIKPIVRYTYYTKENKVRKIETSADNIKLKKGANIIFLYISYIKGKGYILPFGKEKSIRSKPRELLYLDILGPISIALYSGEKYFITFIDNISRFY